MYKKKTGKRTCGRIDIHQLLVNPFRETWFADSRISIGVRPLLRSGVWPLLRSGVWPLLRSGVMLIWCMPNQLMTARRRIQCAHACIEDGNGFHSASCDLDRTVSKVAGPSETQGRKKGEWAE